MVPVMSMDYSEKAIAIEDMLEKKIVKFSNGLS